MPDLHVIDDLPAFALNILEASEASRVRSHLDGCRECRREWLAYQETLAGLGELAPRHEPPLALRQSILAQAASSKAVSPTPAPTTVSERPSWKARAARWLTPSPAFGLAALILIAALAIGMLFQARQINSMKAMQRQGYASVLLNGTSNAPGAKGMVVYTLDGSSGFLVVNGLQPLAAGKQYQLWLIKNNQRTSGGVFSVNPEGYHVLEIASPIALTSYDAFGITIEPSGGSPGPTGAKVLGGKF